MISGDSIGEEVVREDTKETDKGIEIEEIERTDVRDLGRMVEGMIANVTEEIGRSLEIHHLRESS